MKGKCSLEIAVDFTLNQRDIGAKGRGGKSKFDELSRTVSRISTSMGKMRLLTNPFLLQVFGMWSVIHYVASPHWSRDNIVHIFRIQIGLFPVQDEIISSGAQVCCNSPAKKNKREDVAILAR